MKKLTNISFLLIALFTVAGETGVVGQDSPALREPTSADIASWRWINSAQLTPDGRWLVYLLVPDSWSKPPRYEGATAVVRSTYDGTERRYSLGPAISGAGNLKISPSGRWVAFHVVQGSKKSPVPQEVHTSVTLVEVSTGKTREFRDVRSFSFANGKSEYILLDGYLPKIGKPWRDIVVRDLGKGRDLVQEPAAEYSFDKTGSKLAWISNSGLKICDLDSGAIRVLEPANPGTLQKLTWSDNGDALAALSDNALSGRSIVTFRNLRSAQPDKRVFEPTTLGGFPSGYEISAESPTKADFWATTIPVLLWRDDENGLFFGITPQQTPIAAREKTASLILWHWKDQRLPAEKKRTEAQRITDLCFVSFEDGTFKRLGDARLRSVQPNVKGNYAVGFDQSGYAWHDLPNGGLASEPRDYYVVDLRTGERKLVVKNLGVVKNRSLSVPPQLSPDGSVFLYQNNEGDYISYQVAGGAQRNLTAGLPTKFYYDENNPRTRRQPRRGGTRGGVLQGWTKDGTYVLISDYYDIWALPLTGGEALNLTGNGKREGIAYRRFTDLSGRDLLRDGNDEPIYFQFRDPKTGKSGLARRSTRRTYVETINSAHADVSYLKASEADLYVCQLISSVEDGNYYLLGADWKIATRLTNVNPRAGELSWAPEAKYLTYTTAHGDQLTAGLYLPVNYIPGKSYPTVIRNIYERDSSSFLSRTPGGLIDRWQRKGFAVLLADIQPRFNEAGPAAIEGVTAAVEAAVATGIVDRNRIGLIGHSFGGYEIYYIISHRNLFKAAVAEAGVANPISNFGSIRGPVRGPGEPASMITEYDQGFLSQPWWQEWDAYVKNSPLFSAGNINTPLLIVHGDEDYAVPFNQAVEMFNTLRRMGNKPVVLLQYAGEDHTLSKEETKRDMDIRIEQFFGHFLKNEPAPSWWSDGISYFEGQAPAPGSTPASLPKQKRKRS